MNSDWNDASEGRGPGPSQLFGTLRLALLFGSAAVAFALIAAPIAERRTQAAFALAGGIDQMATGSVERAPRGSSYTIRRSVLQETPQAVCIIRQNGTRTGSC